MVARIGATDLRRVIAQDAQIQRNANVTGPRWHSRNIAEAKSLQGDKDVAQPPIASGVQRADDLSLLRSGLVSSVVRIRSRRREISSQGDPASSCISSNGVGTHLR